MTEDDLRGFVIAKAAEHWSVNQSPYLLTSIATDLKKQGQDYKEALGNEKLKQFALRLDGEGALKLIGHPTQKPRVGVIPSDADFAYSEEENVVPRRRERPTHESRAFSPEGGHLIVDLLRGLSRLPDDLLDQVVIPTKVLVALARR